MPRPPRRVREAFGGHDEPVPLAGGRGLAWRVGDLVFKPSDLAADELAWQADVLPTVRNPDFRLSIPRRAVGGELVVDDWTAWTYLPGEHRAGRWAEVIEVGDRFHRALAGLARPSFIAARTDPWAIGDRVAWGEAPVALQARPHEPDDLRVIVDDEDRRSRDCRAFGSGSVGGRHWQHGRRRPYVAVMSVE